MLPVLLGVVIDPPLRSGVPDALVIAVVFVVLLGLEWRYRSRGLRVATALLALLVLGVYAPNHTGARRRALGASRSEWVLPGIGAVADYERGVYTMSQTVREAADFGWAARMTALGVLTWLACAPTRRPARSLGGTEVEP